MRNLIGNTNANLFANSNNIKNPNVLPIMDNFWKNENKSAGVNELRRKA